MPSVSRRRAPSLTAPFPRRRRYDKGRRARRNPHRRCLHRPCSESMWHVIARLVYDILGVASLNAAARKTRAPRFLA